MSKTPRAIKRLAGFSLLELILVIVLIGILAISLGNITSLSVSSYIDAKDRQRFSQSAKWTVEKISREVRDALPQSIRSDTVGGVSCVEFMRVINASTYLNLPATGSINSFTAVAFDLTYQAGLKVAIMPTAPSSVYTAVNVLADVSAISQSGGEATISLAAPTNFANRSPQQRFYLLDTPVSYCLDDSNGQMQRYRDYPISAIQNLPPSGGNGELVGENLRLNGPAFNYVPGALSRAGVLQIELLSQNRSRNLSGNSEAFNVFQQVHIRNVP